MRRSNLQSRPAPAMRAIVAALIATAIGLSFTAAARADKLAEFLFWHEMGKATNNAVRSYNDYQSERRRWRDNIAAAKAALERCGGCSPAQAELDKWQGIENEFQDFAGSVFSTVGMPPVVAQWLGIQMPLARGFSAEEKARMCEVRRQPWVAERSPLCQRKVDEHLACLRASVRGGGLCDWEVASLPGQACYRTAKYYDHCYNANYTAVELEAKAQAERAKGRILPEVVSRGKVKIVFFDDAADAFAPPLPPLALAREIIDDETQELKFRMRKSGAGTLRQATLRTFHWADFAADDRCFMPGAVRDEIELRVCEDLKELNFIHSPLMLLCDYTDVNRALGAHVMFWYGERPAPAVADPRHFLRRSRNHPLAKVADARSECPATIEEAGRVNSRFQTSLASLGVEEVPSSVALRSNWNAELRVKQQAQREAMRTEALASFPLEGVYRVEFATAWYDKRRTGGVVLPEARKKSTAECAVKKAADGKFRLSCREPYKTALAQLRRAGQQDQPRHGALRKFEAEAVIEKGWVVVRWAPDLSIEHEVSGGRLSGWHKPDGTIGHDTIRSSMTRTGDLDRWDPSPQLEELPELSRADVSILRSRGITSLEKLAAISDADILAYAPVVRKFREQARNFLKSAPQGVVAGAAAPPRESGSAQSFAASRAGAGAAAPAAASGTSLTGVWKGQYTCGGGPVALELTLSELDGGLLWGTFAFAPTQQNPKFATGRFYVWGRKHESRLEVELVPGPWIEQPRGYVGVGLHARYGSRNPDTSDPSSGRMIGRITGPCAGADVRRVADRAASLGSMPAEVEQKLKQYGLQPTSKQGRRPQPHKSATQAPVDQAPAPVVAAQSASTAPMQSTPPTAVAVPPTPAGQLRSPAPTEAGSAFEEGVAAYKRRDYAAAHEIWLKLAKQGHAEAQHRLGSLYFAGEGVPKNLPEAVKWQRAAAAQGHAGSQYDLGQYYAHGHGVPQSFAEAAKWYRQAAENGDTAAMSNLGVMYERGQGVPVDLSEAARLYLRAAKRGRAQALHNYGVLLEFGKGVPQDSYQAAIYFRLAAVQSYVPSQHALGELYRLGRGVPRNPQEAAQWYVRAAKSGHLPARTRLAAMYEQGEGVDRDPAKAYASFLVVERKAPKGNESHALATRGLQRLAPQLSSEQLSQAKSYASAIEIHGILGPSEQLKSGSQPGSAAAIEPRPDNSATQAPAAQTRAPAGATAQGAADGGPAQTAVTPATDCPTSGIVIAASGDAVRFRNQSIRAFLSGISEKDSLLRAAYPRLTPALGLGDSNVPVALERTIIDIAAYRCADLARDRASFKRFKNVWVLTKGDDGAIRLDRLAGGDGASSAQSSAAPAPSSSAAPTPSPPPAAIAAPPDKSPTPAPAGRTRSPAPTGAKSAFEEGEAAYKRRDYAAAHEIWLKLAGQGHGDAQYKLAGLYGTGKGTQRNPVEAVRWYRAAAEQGHQRAIYALGIKYANGWGVARNYEEAAKWFQLAVGAGSSSAAHELGQLYEHGRGVPRDVVRAAHLYRKAAEQGHARAQYSLAMLHVWNTVPADASEAIKWLRRAADRGVGDAQYMLGEMHRSGLGVPRDLDVAVRWYDRAAASGHRPARVRLGALYERGEGVERDRVRAYAWYSVVAKTPANIDNEARAQAIQGLQRLATDMRPEDISRAESYAAAIKRKEDAELEEMWEDFSDD